MSDQESVIGLVALARSLTSRHTLDDLPLEPLTRH